MFILCTASLSMMAYAHSSQNWLWPQSLIWMRQPERFWMFWIDRPSLPMMRPTPFQDRDGLHIMVVFSGPVIVALASAVGRPASSPRRRGRPASRHGGGGGGVAAAVSASGCR